MLYHIPKSLTSILSKEEEFKTICEEGEDSYVWNDKKEEDNARAKGGIIGVGENAEKAIKVVDESSDFNDRTEIENHFDHHLGVDRMVEEAFEVCDLNKDGKLSFEQFQLWLAHTPEISEFFESVIPHYSEDGIVENTVRSTKSTPYISQNLVKKYYTNIIYTCI